MGAVGLPARAPRAPVGPRGDVSWPAAHMGHGGEVVVGLFADLSTFLFPGVLCLRSWCFLEHNWSAKVLLIIQALLLLTSPGFLREVSLFT